MDEALPEEHRLLRRTVREIVRDRVAPRASDIDRDRAYPEDVFQLFREHGLFGTSTPEHLGGMGFGTLGLALVVEEVARACASSAQILILNALTTWPLRIAGSRSLRDQYLLPAIRGDLRGAFALTEPNASSDLGSMVTRAKQSNDGGYVVDGEKDFISGSPMADYFILFARTQGTSTVGGMTAFLAPSPQPGIVFLRRDEGMGLKGMPHCDWAFDQCVVPPGHVIGEEGDGARVARLSINAIQPLLAARGLGAAEESLAYARDYALNRRIYGGRLADLQAIQLHMADIAVNVEACRLLTYQAARMVDEERFEAEADAAYLNAAKVFAARTVVRATDNAMQVVGGHGYMEVHPLERMYRDARHLALYMGTDEVLRLRIAGAVLDGAMGYGPAVSRQPSEERAIADRG